MTMNRKRYVSAQLAMFVSLALTATAPLSAAGNFLYVDTTAAMSNNSIPPIPVGGLTLTLPAAAAAYNTAVVTLNMPNLYLNQPTGKSTPMSATISIIAPFSPQGIVQAIGGIGCDTAGINSSARKPMTIVLKVPLGAAGQAVMAEWATNGFSTVNTDTFASMSAILVKE